MTTKVLFFRTHPPQINPTPEQLMEAAMTLLTAQATGEERPPQWLLDAEGATAEGLIATTGEYVVYKTNGAESFAIFNDLKNAEEAVDHSQCDPEAGICLHREQLLYAEREVDEDKLIRPIKQINMAANAEAVFNQIFTDL